MRILIAIFFTISLYADIGTLKKIVDGDTLHFNNAKCRLAYIDTPLRWIQTENASVSFPIFQAIILYSIGVKIGFGTKTVYIKT